MVRSADMQGSIRRAADSAAAAVTEREMQIPIATGALRARVYEAAAPARRAALLIPDLHPSGVDEPRLVAFARQLATSGLTVVTPDIPDLKQFTISAAVSDAIEQSASWLGSQPEFAPDRRIGLMGISFSGGLALAAAGRPSLSDRIAFVFSAGGHDDLARVYKYLCTGVESPPPESASPLTGLMQKRDAATTPGMAASVATGWVPPPRESGATLVLLNIAERVVPAGQIEPLRDAARRALNAWILERDDKSQADAEFIALRALAKTMREPSATLLRYALDRDIVHLGARLAPSIASAANAPALSPARSPKPAVAAFLLHGTSDNLIPAVETLHLAATLRGTTSTHMLLSNALSGTDITQPIATRDLMALGSFWADVLKR